jgi:MFS transporter, ACS family, solute carrier family 17 (sodium-dependent inorganic phosphate cotransporter), other
MMLAAYQTNRVSIITCITLGAALGALSICGYGVNHLDLGPQYASVIMGLDNTIATIPGIISPLIAGYIVPDQTVILLKLFLFKRILIFLISK